MLKHTLIEEHIETLHSMLSVGIVTTLGIAGFPKIYRLHKILEAWHTNIDCALISCGCSVDVGAEGLKISLDNSEVLILIFLVF